MIWHIFKKDARLLWWLSGAVAAVRFAEVAAAQATGLFPDPRLRNLSALLSLGGILAAGFAVCAVVHQDAIPGVRQDWLVRPIRRRDLFLAKLLWVVLLIQIPVFSADSIQGVVAGSGVAASLVAAASRSVYLLLVVDIPFLALASITRNLLEALTACVVISLAFAVFISLMAGSQAQWTPTIGTGIEWLTFSALIAAMMTGSAAILGLQYYRRRTSWARYWMGTLAIVCILTTTIPWQPVFAVQKSLAVGSADSISVTFDPTAGKLKNFMGIPRSFAIELPAQVFIPVRVAGLTEGVAVQSDHAVVRAIDSHSRVYRLESPSRLRARPARGSTNELAYQTAGIPGELYRSIKDQPMRLEIDYSLTLFSVRATHLLPAINADVRSQDLGKCASRINANGTAVQLSCEVAGRAPNCGVAYLEHPPSGLKNPERFDCERPDYGPYLAWQLIPDGMARFGGTLPFRDPNGLASYPVDGPKLAESRIVMQTYRPLDHFTRKLAITEIRLSDWEAAQ